MNLTTVINVPSDGSYFEGHFPGRPILPGVAEIVLALDALAAAEHSEVSIQRIAYTRLRQIVLPGDRLDLTTREVDGGRMRIDLKRDGVLVANGEWTLGLPEPACDNASPATATLGGPRPEIPSLDQLLPHRPPMRFIQSVLAETTESLVCSACIPSTCALVNNSDTPAVVGLEAAAQAAAVWETLQRLRTQGAAEPRVGYLVALRDVVFYADRIPADQELIITVRLEAAAPPLCHYQVEVCLGGKTLLRGIIATFLKEDGE